MPRKTEKKKMKQFLSLVLGALLITPVLSSCGGNTPQTATTPPVTDTPNTDPAPKEYTEIERGYTEYGYDYIRNTAKIVRGADPTVLYHDGLYYMYATSIGTGFKVWTSKDLSSWSERGIALQADGKWNKTMHWAPCVVERNGVFYMFFTACHDESVYGKSSALWMGVATATDPLGPFKLVGDEPFLKCEQDLVDPFVFFDDDGSIYLYFNYDRRGIGGSLDIVAARLTPDLKLASTEFTTVLSPSEPWELQQGRIVEGAVMLKHNGLYYLMYSCNSYTRPEYAVGYATAESPLGPFTKYENNPVLTSDGSRMVGTGHHDVVASPDGTELFCVYHSLTDPTDYKIAGRMINCDRLSFSEDGVLRINGPTTVGQPQPSGVRGTTVLYSGYTLGGVDTEAAALLSDKLWYHAPAASLKATDGIAVLTAEFDGCAPYQIYLYPAEDGANAPVSVDAIINNQYRIKDIPFLSKTSPLIFTLEGLPEGVEAKTVRLEFHTDGTDTLSLREVIFVSKDQTK